MHLGLMRSSIGLELAASKGARVSAREQIAASELLSGRA